MGYINRIGGPSTFIGPSVPRERNGTSKTPRSRNAVVPVEPIHKRELLSAPTQRPAAPFLAHLIATDRNEPQTRAHRRATTSDARATYAARQDRPVRPGALLSLSA